MNKSLQLIILFKCVLLTFAQIQNNGYKRVVESRCISVIAKTNQLYEDSVSRDKPMVFVFEIERKYIQRSHVSAKELQTTNLVAEVGTNQDVSLKYPILFSVRQQKFISSLEVPFQFDTGGTNKTQNELYYYASRTLCIDDDDDDEGTDGRNVTIRVSTQSKIPKRFYIILKLTEDFQLMIGKEMKIDVSPTTPKYFGFSFARPDLSTVKIRALSNSTDCMTISIQTVECPIYDKEHNVRYQGLWQTMSTSAAMTVTKYGRFNKGFVVVLVAHNDKEVCGRKDSFLISNKTVNTNTMNWDSQKRFQQLRQIKDPRSKSVKIIITDEGKMPLWIILLCLFIPIITTFLTALIVLALFRNRHEWMGQITQDNFDDEPASITLLSPNGKDMQLSLRSTSSNGRRVPTTVNETEAGRSRRRVRPISTIPNPNSTGGCRWKADLYIADFDCKGFTQVQNFSKRFYWTIAIVAIFYSIPVYQLVLHYLRVLYRTGEYDICYYNYLCAQRLGLLIDFNHFWSNASYVIFGIFFIIIVRRRSRNLCLNMPTPEERKEDSACCCCSLGNVGQICCCTFSKIYFKWDHGVPAHFGVFYALGVALTMEGFLSAAYHLCPNQSTFQFDTCFMYVIAVLLLLKIYQFRHPVHFGANHTFAILAGFVIISVLGLIFERGNDNAKFIFKMIFLPSQYIVMIFLCIYYYAVGYVRKENGDFVTDWSIYGYLGQLKSQKINGDRFILPLISFSICIAVLVYSELSGLGFASYLLYILVGNVLGTTLYYVGIMKPLHGEFKNYTWVQPSIYFVAAGIIGTFSLQYFVRAPAQWELSASASRAENEDCLYAWFPFHPFYDSHDAWHFLSAAALFLSFMGLLIVDDDLITTHQKDIPVF